MKVLVNARFFGLPSHQAKFRFLLGNLLQWNSRHAPENILILSDLPEATSILATVMQPVMSAIKLEMVPESKVSFWRMIYWYDYRLPARIREYKPDLVLHGDHFCSLKVSVPQIMVGDDILRNHLKGTSRSLQWLFSKRWDRMISNAAGVIAWAEDDYEQLIRQRPALTDKIFLSKLIPLKIIRALSWDEKQQIFNRLSSGLEYFLAVAEGAGSASGFMDLLKGFSWFKKRFQSNMKLLVFGVLNQKWLNAIPLDSYKYRNDVILCDSKYYLEALSACYAMLYVSGREIMPLPISEAFQSGVPIVAAKESLSLSISNDAIAWKEDSDPEQWGRLMGELYKDENFRKQLINKGYEWIENETDNDGNSLCVWLDQITQATIRTFADL